MLKILYARLQQEFPDVQAVFRKERGTRDQIANIFWITEKAREFQKTSPSVSSTTLKPLTAWIMTNCGKFLERREYQTILLVSWETCMWVKNQQLGLADAATLVPPMSRHGQPHCVLWLRCQQRALGPHLFLAVCRQSSKDSRKL